MGLINGVGHGAFLRLSFGPFFLPGPGPGGLADINDPAKAVTNDQVFGQRQAS